MRNVFGIPARTAAVLVLSLAVAGGATAAGPLTINGAGATFPYPLYSKWFYEYSNANPGVRFNYQSIGSGGGIKQIIAGTVNFGATDAPMTEEGMKKLPGPILHIPTALGAVVPVYNLDGVASGLTIDYRATTAEALADEGEQLDVIGKVMGFIPLRNRREGMTTHVGEGMTEFRCGDAVGYGLSEYLDQVK